MKIGVIIQARMSSGRLPGKVLRLVRGKPMIGYLLDSVRASGAADFVLATSLESSDDPVAEYCESAGVKCFRGALDDVAGRFVGALDRYGFDAFVRISGDSPLMNPGVINKGMEIFSGGGYDLVTNVLERTFPKGQSVEVVDAASYRRAYEEMNDPADREHVTRFFYRNCDRFRIRNFVFEPPSGNIQLSVDTPEDMAIFEKIISFMERPHTEYEIMEMLDLRARALKGRE